MSRGYLKFVYTAAEGPKIAAGNYKEKRTPCKKFQYGGIIAADDLKVYAVEAGNFQEEVRHLVKALGVYAKQCSSCPYRALEGKVR